MLDLKDVIVTCELSYELNGYQPSSIRETAQRMLDSYKPASHTPTFALLSSLVQSQSPRVYLNAASLKLRYLEDDGNFVEEKLA